MLMLISALALLSAGSAVLATPTTTVAAKAAVPSQIRTDQDPVYHLYIQSTPVGTSYTY